MIDYVPPDVPQAVVEFAKKYHPPTNYSTGQEFRYITVVDGEELYSVRNKYGDKFPSGQYIPILYDCNSARQASSREEFGKIRGLVLIHVFGEEEKLPHICK